MTSSPDQDAGLGWPRKPPPPWLVAFCLATAAAVIVGLVQWSQLSHGGQGAVGALAPVIATGYAEFTWIVTFPSLWLVFRLLRGARKRRRDRRG